jgi:hypothetical protein
VIGSFLELLGMPCPHDANPVFFPFHFEDDPERPDACLVRVGDDAYTPEVRFRFGASWVW